MQLTGVINYVFCIYINNFTVFKAVFVKTRLLLWTEEATSTH